MRISDVSSDVCSSDLADLAAIEVLGEGDDIVPGAIALTGDLHAMDVESMAALAVADQTLVKCHVGTQLGNFLFAFGDGLLQALVGGTSAFVRAFERAGVLSPQFDLRPGRPIGRAHV